MSALEDKYRAVLTHCKTANDLVECYLDDEEPNRFSVGFVESVGHVSFCIVSVDENGEFDGRIVARIDDIARLHVGGDYLGALKILHENRGKIFEGEPVEAFQKEFNDFSEPLKFARDRRLLVSIYDFDKGQTVGFVSEIGEDWVQIEPVKRDGRSNGFTIFRTEDISRVNVGGKSEQARRFVHQTRLGR